MTGRPAYGDFASAARRHLDALPGPGTGSRQIGGPATTADIEAGVRAVVTVMARYARDICAVLDAVPWDRRAGLAMWLRAARNAREALANATALLQSEPGQPHAGPAHGSQPARPAGGLEAAAAAMGMGRDLLHTHLDPRPGQHPEGRSEWAPVITSAPVACALLNDIGRWARQVAPHGCQGAVTGLRGTAQSRRNLNAACQWLWVLTWAVGSAQEQQPLSAGYLRLLNAIPVNAVPRRLVPDGGEPVAALCEGTVAAAERLRAAARYAAAQAGWSPALTRESLRHIAGNCAITASNCAIVLRTLTGQPRPAVPGTSASIAEARRAVESARAAWLTATGQWDVITTDSRGALSRAAFAAADLALWTGRLTYDSPEWTPKLGPRHPARPADDLAPTAEDLRRVVTAVHHACHTLAQVAAFSQSQVRTASTAGRLLVATRRLPETFDVPYRFAPAPPVLAEPLLAAYQDAGSASDLALSAVASVADQVKAPSRVLATACAVAKTSPADPVAARDQPAGARPASGHPRLVPPGPLERILLDLDVTNPADLAQAAAIDTAADQLIVRTAHAARPRAPGQAPDLNRSSGTAELISGVLATSGDQAPAALRPQHATARTWPSATASPPANVIMRARLPASLTAAREARAAVRHALSERGLDQLSDDAELLASELVANAAEHGDGKPIRLALYRQAGPGGQPGIRCEVTDTSPHLPRRRDPSPDRERGRGLAIVAALASASGVRTNRAGKTTWFTLTTAPGPSRSATRHAEAEPEAGA